jgi:nucleoside diphosphate kinase
MNVYERLYDESENTNVRFVGFASNDVRYDFGIIYTNQFFGKPLIVCMQSGRSTLMCSEEALRVEHIQKAFNVTNSEEAEQLSIFFQHNLPSLMMESQYY